MSAGAAGTSPAGTGRWRISATAFTAIAATTTTRTPRLFRYPCSFLVCSDSFDRMPAEVRDYVLRRVYDVLTGTDADKAFAHLSQEDRQAILEIVRDTKSNLPAYWRE